jgi:ubiquitin carboxyl-terminal hydrolase 9/24
MTTVSAFDLLVSLCTGCLPNLSATCDLLNQLFYPSLLGQHLSAQLTSASSMRQTYFDQSLSNNATPTAAQLSQLSNDCTISTHEWDYLPPIGQRPHNGFVGLKNAGATCYMNSVLQQLFMIKPIRNYILSTEILNNNNTSAQNEGKLKIANL